MTSRRGHSLRATEKDCPKLPAKKERPQVPAVGDSPQVPSFRKTVPHGYSFKHVPNDYSVVSSLGSWGDTAFLGMETLVSEVSFLLNAVSVLTRSLSVTIL